MSASSTVVVDHAPPSVPLPAPATGAPQDGARPVRDDVAMATTTPAESTEQRVRDIFGALFGERDLDRAQEGWSDASVDHFLALGISVRGRAALRTFFEELFAAMPDWRLEIEHVVASADHAVVQWTGTGTHTGAAWQGIEPTGRRVDVRGCDVIRFAADGTIDENTVYYDGAGYARQIGMLPSAGSSADRAMLAAFNAATKARARFARARTGSTAG
jgi:steroid delta-isomerase-like uncharacterized protein